MGQGHRISAYAISDFLQGKKMDAFKITTHQLLMALSLTLNTIRPTHSLQRSAYPHQPYVDTLYVLQYKLVYLYISLFLITALYDQKCSFCTVGSSGPER